MKITRERLKPWTAQGVRFVHRRITRENLGAELAKHLSPGDLLVDLAWNIDCCEILQWCHDHGVLYVNTSVEVWDPYAGAKQEASDRADALLAAHEHPPHDRRLARARARRRCSNTAQIRA